MKKYGYNISRMNDVFGWPYNKNKKGKFFTDSLIMMKLKKSYFFLFIAVKNNGLNLHINIQKIFYHIIIKTSLFTNCLIKLLKIINKQYAI